jgi:hypothetical protein
MRCKYQDHPFPPCRFEEHPTNKNIYFCPHCQEWYDVRDVGNQSPKWLLFIMAIIIVVIASLHSSNSVQPNEDNSSPPNSIYSD